MENTTRTREHFEYLASRLKGDSVPEDVHYDMSVNLKTFLENGFDQSVILRGLTPEDIYHNFDLLASYGVKINTDEVTDRMTDDFVWEHLSELVERGFDSNRVLRGRRCSRRNEKYRTKFLVEHEDKFLANLATLPDAISIDTLVESIPMDDIISFGLEGFIDDYESAGGDINRLSEKFVEEIGYTGRYEDVMALAQIIERGGTNDVSFDEFIASIDMSIFDDEDEAFLSRILEELE